MLAAQFRALESWRLATAWTRPDSLLSMAGTTVPAMEAVPRIPQRSLAM